MRIFLTSNASYEPPRGGSTRSNLAWLKQLAGAGHICRVVSASHNDEDDTITREGVEIRRVHDLVRNAGVLRDEIATYHPDWVLVSSEDLSHLLLREAVSAAPDRLVYLAHTPQFFPFGPESWNVDDAATAMVRHARRVVTIGHHMAGYVAQHAGVQAKVIHPPIYGNGPWPRFGRFDGELILMVNPCKVKGIDIFLALAERLPEYAFAALSGWGTTATDRRALASLPNVRLLETVTHIDEVLSRTRVLLMPSLWYEGFGLIAMEAMMRGIPVIASDSGGLVEAKQGTGLIVPVKPIRKYLPEFDENHMPKPEIPAQAIEPWETALRTLLTDRGLYEREAQSAWVAAESFISRVRPEQMEESLASISTESGRGRQRARLRILLAHNSTYFPSHGGGDRSNRLLMEALAARAHSVRVVARVEHFGSAAEDRFLRELEMRGIGAIVQDGVVRFMLNGVEVHTLTESPHMRKYLERQIEHFDPDVIVTSTDDPAQLLLQVALRASRARVVHLVRATIAVPFGPDASGVSDIRTERLRSVAAIVGVSEYTARYVREHGGMPAVHVPISLMDPGEYHNVSHFENPYVCIVNPCAVKGIGIFLALADRMSQVAFAAVPTWGTTAADLEALRRRRNITLLAPVDNIEQLLKLTRVLLVPSVWAEARSRIVVEAMLRGVPVIASDIGGIPEAKLGVPYLLPVNPVSGYQAGVDQNMVPVAQVPQQDIRPWEAALRRLTTDREHWLEVSQASRRAALEYVEKLSVKPFEDYLESIVQSPRKVPLPATAALSPEKRALLALRLKQKAAARRLQRFDCAASTRPDIIRLFCFPHAGGGTLIYRGWKKALAENIAICPALLPGREAALHETPIDDMTRLIALLAEAIEPHLQGSFAFFGHSMGAGVAFELCRELRRRKRPLPTALIVSAARAPQYRLKHTPAPEADERSFLGQISKLEGFDAAILANPEALRAIVPALRADVQLYSNYIYHPEAPLDVPIFAYSGVSDPNVHPEQMAAWREQTTLNFRQREFAGNHFYLQSDQADVLAALMHDVGTHGRPEEFGI